jgi:hypothetical protein
MTGIVLSESEVLAVATDTEVVATVSVTSVESTVIQDVVNATTQENVVQATVDETRVYGVYAAIQGPPGVPGGTEGSGFSTVNKGIDAVRGQVVATHTTGIGFVLANASTSALLGIGLLVSDTVANASGTVQSSGIFEMDDWTAITGSADLSSRGVYYLDVTDGSLTTTPPTLNPAVVHRVGVAVTPRKLLIEIWSHIQL